MSCLCLPKELSEELPDPQAEEEVIPDESFTQVESSAKDMSALSQAFSNQQTLTITSLEKQTVTVNTSSPGANSFDQWKKAQMQPKKKHFSDSAAGGTRLGMYQVTSDFSPIDHLILGNLAANKDPPRPTYFPGQLFMVPCGETKDAIVYTMSGKQKKLANGTLKLTDKTFIVFDESCSGVEFRNLVIEGGHVVCHGKGCKVTFTNVTFKQSTLVTMQKATSTLNKCSFVNTDEHLLSVMSKDVGSRVVMSGGGISGGENGAFVSERGHLECSDVTFQQLIAIGIQAETSKSLLVLKNCTMKQFISIKKNHFYADRNTDGISLRSRSAGIFENVTIEGADRGLYAYDSIATLTNCTLTGSTEKAVEVRGGAKLTVKGSSLSRTGPGPRLGVFSGLVADDSGTTAALNGCTIDENYESAVSVMGGAHVTVSDCKASYNKGINARDRRGTVKLGVFNCIGSGRITVKNSSIKGESPASGGRGVELTGVSRIHSQART